MATIDDETSAAAIDFMKGQQAAGKPCFVWFNSTRMHLRTHVRAENRGRYTHGDSDYLDGMIGLPHESAVAAATSPSPANDGFRACRLAMLDPPQTARASLEGTSARSGARSATRPFSRGES